MSPTDSSSTDADLIAHQQRGEIHILRPGSQLDAMSAPRMRELFAELGEPPIRVIIDLSQVEFIDSSGIGAVVFFLKRVRAQGGELALAGLRGQPAQLVSMLRLDRAVTSAETVEQAEAAFKSSK